MDSYGALFKTAVVIHLMLIGLMLILIADKLNVLNKNVSEIKTLLVTKPSVDLTEIERVLNDMNTLDFYRKGKKLRTDK